MTEREGVSQINSVIKEGSYSILTDLKVEQIDRMAGESGYVELLKIDSPPQGKCGYVVNKYHVGYCLKDSNCTDYDNSDNYKFYAVGVFAEFNNLEDAKLAFSDSMYRRSDRKEWFALPEAVRHHFYDESQDPWFYLNKDQIVTGVFVYPNKGQLEFSV